MDRRKTTWWKGLLALGAAACLLTSAALTLGAQDVRLVVTPTGTRSIYIAHPPEQPPAIVAPYVQPYPYSNQFGVNSVWQVPQGKTIVRILNDNIQVEWSGNYFNARVFTTPSKTFTFDVDISGNHQNIVRGRTATGFSLKADWPHLPVTETFLIKGDAEVELDDGSTVKVFVDEKAEFYFHGSGSIAPFPTTPGAAPVGNTIPLGFPPIYEFIWRAPGTLFLKCPNIPPGEFVVDTNVPGINRVKAVLTGMGPVVVYQAGTKVRYKMFDGINRLPTADGEVGSGTLIDVDFRPGHYGTKAKITIQDNQQTCHHMFTIDCWGNKGTTGRVGRPLCSGLLQQWEVSYKSVVYLFEFDPRTGTLTCSDNYKGWKKVVDTGIDGLIVPAATGGGAVVVYNKGNQVHADLLFWVDGRKMQHISLGSGVLLGTIYTIRGSYGAEGTATIRTSSNSAKNVDFCIDMWGQYGCNRVRTENPGPSAPFPPDPPPGFPGSGGGGGPPSDVDSDGDGFSDEYETDSGTDPNDPNSYPQIDLSIVLLIDKSGSMQSDNKMENAKKAAVSALSRINPATEVGVMAYSGGCDEIFPIVADFSQNTAKLTQKIQTITAGGGTPLSPALLQARKLLWERSHGKQGLIILLCDGQNSCPPNEADAARQIFQRIISHNRLRFPGAREAGIPLLSFLVPKAYAGTQEQTQVLPGGAETVPEGQAPPETIPDEGIPGDSSRGGIDVPPPGVVPPQTPGPVPWVPPYGTSGVNTAVPAAAAGMSNQQMPIQVSTIGFGLQNDPQAQQALVEVAKAGGGQAYDAQNLQELTSAFTQAITGQPAAGGGGAPVVAVKPAIGWPVIVLIVLAAASLFLLMALVIVKSRRSGEAGGINAGLDIIDADGGVRSVRIRGARTTIGRNPDNSLVLQDAEVSGRHAEIVVSADGFLIRDLGSANGTFVRGEGILESRLYAGDEVVIGRTRMILKG